ncbi:hypothetical protein A2635_01445 [Candidatus Peribacteria bacterium RIFCSPHIGHO2_01_FULL_51_9]|nr:MAG: hypothetical protein A2635_01445 [Candidatus Peribacteria bacterium RIFCSPHIGHO2_01_FULL_51_9]
MSKKNILIAASFLTLTVIGLFVLMYFPETASYDELITNNVAFKDGEQARVSGDHKAALGYYDAALQTATNEYERGEIEIRMAIVQAVSGNYEAAIKGYKAVAANETYPAMMRAYAVDNMATLYFSTKNEQITSLIFAEDPYKALVNDENPSIMYRQLSEYASSFYPIANAELHIANWYATEIARLSKEKAEDDVMNQYKAILQAKLASADRDIERVSNSPHLYSDLPLLLLMRARIIANIENTGDPSFGSAEEAFAKAMTSYAQYVHKTADAFARLYYAEYLFNKYPDREDFIIVLTPLSSDPDYEQSRLIRDYLRAARMNNKREIIHNMAMADEQFKEFLLSLGWTSSDFSKK